MRLIELLETSEYVTPQQLRVLENVLDRLFKTLNIDVELSGKHFIDRVTDERNEPPITIFELRDAFAAFFKEQKKILEKIPVGFEAVLNDINTDINIPFIIRFNSKTKELILAAKTVMRKKNFRSPDSFFKVNSQKLQKPSNQK